MARVRRWESWAISSCLEKSLSAKTSRWLTRNNALLLKNLHKFFNHADLPWVRLVWETYYNDHPPDNLDGSFWWRDNIKLLDLYKGLATCSIGNGHTALFWTDLWNGHLLNYQHPQLHSFVKSNKQTVEQVCQAPNFQDLFNLPLSVQAYDQYQQVMVLVQQLNLTDEEDAWSYIWNSGIYSSVSV